MSKSHRHCPNCGRPYEWYFDKRVMNISQRYTCGVCGKEKCWDCGGVPKTIGMVDSCTDFVNNPVCEDCITRILKAHMAGAKEEKK